MLKASARVCVFVDCGCGLEKTKQNKNNIVMCGIARAVLGAVAFSATPIVICIRKTVPSNFSCHTHRHRGEQKMVLELLYNKRAYHIELLKFHLRHFSTPFYRSESQLDLGFEVQTIKGYYIGCWGTCSNGTLFLVYIFFALSNN